MVPFAPGGPADVAARVIAVPMSLSLGQSVFIENRAGAGGNIGIGAVAKSDPDGTTFLVTSGAFALNPSLFEKVPYDALADFEAVLEIAVSPNIFLATPESGIKSVRIEYAGEVAKLNVKPLTAAAIAGVLRPLLSDVNMVSASAIAKERGMVVEEVTRGQDGAYESYVRLTVKTGDQERSVAGTVFSDGRPRIIQVKGIEMEAQFYTHMLYVTNSDKPGFIGKVGALMGEVGINIARLNLGRDKPGGDAIALIAIDSAASDAVIGRIKSFEHVNRVQRLEF